MGYAILPKIFYNPVWKDRFKKFSRDVMDCLNPVN